MEVSDFSQPMRQSSKGIIIIFGFNAFKFFKRFFVIFIAFGLSLTKKKSFANLSPNTILLIIVGIIIILFVVAVLKYLNFKFYLNDDDFHLSRGIMNKDKTVIPKSKIQNVYIKQNLLQQIINVVSVNIETAGDDKSEIEISALDKPTALRLKKQLFNKVDTTSSNQIEYIEQTTVFFKASMKRLLLEGLSQNHLKSFAIIMSFVFGLYYEFKDYLKDLNLQERIENSVHFDSDTLLSILIANLIIIVIVIFISSLFSVVKTLIVNFGLEVIEHQKTIEINKGLLNKVSLSLTPSRIQNLVITTNRLKQYLGLHTVSVKQAMVNNKQKKSFVIVALEKIQLYHLLDKLLKQYNHALQKNKPEPYYNRISAIEMFLFILVINIPAYVIFGNEKWWINLILFPIAALYIYISFKKAYFTLDDHFVTIGSGVIDTTTNILEIHKIQSVEIKQSIFQKRRNIASVIISTASKDVKIPYIKEELAIQIHNFLLFKVESQQKDWM
ncbi:putative membrane protein [Formosa sp. Hel1_31_208]|uniref:PH domain-containing protein n=1 Tax=Formosa sp. Hel1_31_208 TaxID=1798225 RepID=UPI00087CE47D|nr:PH domain-containing protein [Formosa sp. Hel1_31_208]SDS33318.1 putative membrane protein [Formosa sp. Hel1_31_208]